MRFPLHIATDMMKWQLKNWWAGKARVPVVLMLEPLHTCNLACIGCSPERYTGDLYLCLAHPAAAVIVTGYRCSLCARSAHSIASFTSCASASANSTSDASP